MNECIAYWHALDPGLRVVVEFFAIGNLIGWGGAWLLDRS